MSYNPPNALAGFVGGFGRVWGDIRSEAMVWLDEYTGAKFAYTTKYRPASAGITVPKDGYLVRLDTDPAARREGCPFGVIYYSRELTADEVERFELRRL